MAEGDGLLNRCTVNTVPWVRIPSPPPETLTHWGFGDDDFIFPTLIPTIKVWFNLAFY